MNRYLTTEIQIIKKILAAIVTGSKVMIIKKVKRDPFIERALIAQILKGVVVDRNCKLKIKYI